MTNGGLLAFPDGAAVLVTGAASGIGRATAELAANLGLSVALWDLKATAVTGLAAQLRQAGSDSIGIGVDVTDGDAVRAACAQTQTVLGHIGFLVNNAGPSSFGSRDFNDGLRAAAGSVAQVTEAWLALGRREGDAVVNVSSVAGTYTGVGSEGWYPAAKAAIAGYTRYLAVQRPGGIRANAVAPGLIRTPRVAEFIEGAGAAIIERNPMHRAGEPEDVAAAICFLLSPAAGYINGVVLPVDGGSLLVL